jgi:hypothetical protein
MESVKGSKANTQAHTIESRKKTKGVIEAHGGTTCWKNMKSLTMSMVTHHAML